jgi:hypothetical protein
MLQDSTQLTYIFLIIFLDTTWTSEFWTSTPTQGQRQENVEGQRLKRNSDVE